jgi:hypothetical protein
MQLKISEKNLKLFFALLFFIIAIACLIYSWKVRNVSELKPLGSGEPKSSMEVLKDLESSSKPVTTTLEQQATELKALDKTSKPVKISEEERLKMIKQFSQ